MSPTNVDQPTAANQTKPRSKWPIILIFLLSLAPVLAAVLVYFNPDLRPSNSLAYGTLIEPQRPFPTAEHLPLKTLDGQAFDVSALAGKWVLVSVDGGNCEDACAKKLFIWRNAHASQGKEVVRLKRVWFITDDEPVPDKVLEAYKGTVMLRVSPASLTKFLGNTSPGDPSLEHGLWIIDPLGNLILRYQDDGDPSKIRDELTKLLKNSRIG